MRTSLPTLQTKLYDALASHTPLINRITGVYDYVPENVKAPYVAIGDPTVNDWGTKTFNGEEVTFTLNVWSSYKGKSEVYEIFNLILEALDNPLVLDGFEMQFQRREYMEVIDDNISGLKHGVIRLRFKISQ